MSTWASAFTLVKTVGRSKLKGPGRVKPQMWDISRTHGTLFQARTTPSKPAGCSMFCVHAKFQQHSTSFHASIGPVLTRNRGQLNSGARVPSSAPWPLRSGRYAVDGIRQHAGDGARRRDMRARPAVKGRGDAGFVVSLDVFQSLSALPDLPSSISNRPRLSSIFYVDFQTP